MPCAIGPVVLCCIEPVVFEMVVFCFSLVIPHRFFPFQVKMRILMGTYALSAGYYDAYYKRAQQVTAEQRHPIQCLNFNYCTSLYVIL